MVEEFRSEPITKSTVAAGEQDHAGQIALMRFSSSRASSSGLNRNAASAPKRQNLNSIETSNTDPNYGAERPAQLPGPSLDFFAYASG